MDGLLNSLRLRLGNPKTSEISDEALRGLVESAERELVRLKPAYAYYDIALVPGKSLYTVEEDVVRIANCWFSTVNVATMVGQTGAVENYSPGTMDLDTVWHNPSLMTLVEQKFEHWLYRTETGWEYDHNTKQLRLIPTPKAKGFCVYKAVVPYKYELMDEQTRGYLADLCYVNGLELLAVTRSRVSSLPVGGGSVSFDTRSLLEFAKAVKKEVRKSIGSSGSSVIVG